MVSINQVMSFSLNQIYLDMILLVTPLCNLVSATICILMHDSKKEDIENSLVS